MSVLRVLVDVIWQAAGLERTPPYLPIPLGTQMGQRFDPVAPAARCDPRSCPDRTMSQNGVYPHPTYQLDIISVRLGLVSDQLDTLPGMVTDSNLTHGGLAGSFVEVYECLQLVSPNLVLLAFGN